MVFYKFDFSGRPPEGAALLFGTSTANKGLAGIQILAHTLFRYRLDYVGDENDALHSRLARFESSSAMERQRITPTLSFSARCLQEAERLRAEAKTLQAGPERDQLIRKARQADTAAHIDEWLRSPGLQSPK